MVDAQNERTGGQKHHRKRRRRRGRKPAGAESVQRMQQPEPQSTPAPVAESDPPPPRKVTDSNIPVVRPADIEPPTVRSEEYCIHHMASFSDNVPMEIRSNMTTVRHLQVDHFGEATLFCDCLHDGFHEWPHSMQKIETAIELDQFLADSTSEA